MGEAACTCGTSVHDRVIGGMRWTRRRGEADGRSWHPKAGEATPGSPQEDGDEAATGSGGLPQGFLLASPSDRRRGFQRHDPARRDSVALGVSLTMIENTSGVWPSDPRSRTGAYGREGTRFRADIALGAGSGRIALRCRGSSDTRTLASAHVSCPIVTICSAEKRFESYRPDPFCI